MKISETFDVVLTAQAIERIGSESFAKLLLQEKKFFHCVRIDFDAPFLSLVIEYMKSRVVVMINYYDVSYILTGDRDKHPGFSFDTKEKSIPKRRRIRS